ncbi:hypothetical protein DPMN_176847 [Dreissena polymorpha]|uniref:Uncharacterized protein n=1 Tax=Dreissena polymorpha TaxID=45954 RepID=A0A9D4IIG0_DREPO|nr:hypothetical protein DPMN_176847 [Dreissena polymorpha]
MSAILRSVQSFPWKDNAKDTQDNHTSISIGGRPISYLRFADGIDLMGGTSSELHTKPTDSMKEHEHTRWRSAEVEDHDEQHEQHQCKHHHERQKAGRDDHFKVLFKGVGNPVQIWCQ